MRLPIIHIIGLPGAGKTTLTEKLQNRFGVPIFRIGHHRARFPQTPVGEADAWVALFSALSKRGWKNCILETTGLNIRGNFLKEAIPFSCIFTVKLEASRQVLFVRIKKKKKEERGGDWLYSRNYKDKYEFVRKLFKSFKNIAADYRIDTDELTKAQVYKKVLGKIIDRTKYSSLDRLCEKEVGRIKPVTSKYIALLKKSSCK